jgi:hypothetical protein
MNARVRTGGAVLLSVAAVRALIEPTCWSQTPPTPSSGAAAKPEANDPGKEKGDRPKRQWDPGKLSSLQETLVVLGPARLLAAPAVQEELGLTKKQREQIASLEDRRSRRMMESFASLPPGHPGSRNEAMKPVVRALRLEKWQVLDGVLSKAQKKRLLEIALQTEGPLAVLWPEIQAELRLAPGQQVVLAELETGIRSSLTAYRRSIRAVYYRPDPEHPMPPGSPEEARDRVTAHAEQLDQARSGFLTSRERAEQQIARILTRKQKERFNRMMGEPFEVAHFQRPGGGDFKPEDVRRFWERREAGESRAAESRTEAGEAAKLGKP